MPRTTKRVRKVAITPPWLGVDVGARRKGFHTALVDEQRLLDLSGGLTVDAVVARVESVHPAIVAIDSPRSCAPDGRRTRAGERQLARAVCGIRWTPDAAHVRANPYYDWIVEGLALFDALADRGVAVIEVFPTASWTRWFGQRGTRSRSAWTTAGLASLGLDGAPARTNQDERDAVAAAVTAREHSLGLTESFGEIVVPTNFVTNFTTG
jgi:predicted nuclease with RNAse H fold